MKMRAATMLDLQWIRERAHCELTPRARAMVAEDSKGVIRGMVAYDCFTPNSCQVHMAVESPIAWRYLIPACFVFPFDVLGLGVVVGVVCGSNEKSLRMTKKLGFREVYRVRDGWEPGEDMVVHELRRADVRWLEQPKEAA